MGTISKRKHRSFLPASSQLRYAAAYILITAAALFLLNLYASTTIRSMTFHAQADSLESKAQLLSNALLQLDELSAGRAAQAVNSMEELHTTRTVVTDAAGVAVYDSLTTGNAEGKTLLFPDLITALEGQSLKYEVYFKLILATGMRRGEACGLRWSDIDWHQRALHIRRNVVKLSGQPILVKEPKTRAGVRVVYLSKELCKLLRVWQKESVWEKEQRGEGGLEEEDYLFRQPGGDPMVPSTFTFRFKKILREGNLPDNLNVHSLRHTNASMLIAQGVDVRTVAGLLGHAQPSTTLDIYSHAFDKNKKLAQQKLAEAMGL